MPIAFLVGIISILILSIVNADNQSDRDRAAILGSPGEYQEQGGISEAQRAYLGFASGLWEPASIPTSVETITTGMGMTVRLSVAGLEHDGVNLNGLVLDNFIWAINEEERILGQAFPFEAVQVLDSSESCGRFSVSPFIQNTAIIQIGCFHALIIAHEVAHSWFLGNDIHEKIADEIGLQTMSPSDDVSAYGRGQGMFGDLRRHYGDAEFNRRLTPLMNPNATMTEVRAAFGDNGGAATKIIDSSEVITTDKVRH